MLAKFQFNLTKSDKSRTFPINFYFQTKEIYRHEIYLFVLIPIITATADSSNDPWVKASYISYGSYL